MSSELISISEAADRLRRGSLTPGNLLQQCLERIDRYDRRVRAWVVVDQQGARHAARQCERDLASGRDLGPLHGIPVGIKDIIDVQGLPTRAGSPLRENHVADRDAPLVAGLRRVGAVLCVFAPRNMAEFARVLVPGGLLVVVTPTASHLAGLRERHGLLGIEPDKDDRLLRSASGYVEAVGRWTVEYAKPASAGVVRDLIAMGPNAFHGVPDDVAPADVDVSVHVWCFRTPLPV